MPQIRQLLHDQLQQLYAILQSFPVLESKAHKPPIIDGHGFAQDGEQISGSRVFKDAVRREAEILEQFLAKSEQNSELSTNAPYFVAVWNEILSAPAPIVAIGKVFELSDGKGEKQMTAKPRFSGVKVDVVADEGRRWIRVNTIKNSRILAEFREIDSYLTGSENDSDSDGSFERPTEQDNSLLRMGRTLVAASAVPIPGTYERPSVTLRLTRLQPDGETDPRVAQTIESLKSIGIDVQLGERTLYDDAGSSPSTSRLLVPTRRINLDLSMLIAFISDISHARLPCNKEDAWSRFRNTRSRKPGKSDSDDIGQQAEHSEGDGEGSEHSRALSMQCIQEMEHGIIDEVVGRLETISSQDGVIEFWATEEACHRCLHIVEKIGGKNEKRRANALLGTHSPADIQRCRDDFWRGSRYSSSDLPSLLPIHMHSSKSSKIPRNLPSLFWGHLIQTCRHILSQDNFSHPRLYRKEVEVEPPKVTRVNGKLTVHTAESILAGAWEGMTTLTANRASVRALLREVREVRQGEGAGFETGGESCDRTAAVLWIVEPRSLGEGMRRESGSVERA